MCPLYVRPFVSYLSDISVPPVLFLRRKAQGEIESFRFFPALPWYIPCSLILLQA